MTAYERLCAARAKGRPTSRKYIDNIFDSFFELHGDRFFADDLAVRGGIAELNGRPVTVVSMEKGEDTKEKIARNFGSPNPEPRSSTTTRPRSSARRRSCASRRRTCMASGLSSA